MTELVEDQRSGFSHEVRLGGGERMQGNKTIIRGGGKMRRITPAQWEWGSLCGAASNMLSKRPVKCLSGHAQPFLLSYMDCIFPESCREHTHWEGSQLRKGLQYPCLKQKVGLEETICQEQLEKICSCSPLRHLMEVLFHLLDPSVTEMITVSNTPFRKITLSGMQFLSHKKTPKPHKQNNLKFSPVDCDTGTCGSQTFHCSEGRKQEGLFICSTVFGTTDLSGYLERQSRASMMLHTYFPQLWICPYCLKLHFFPAELKQ